VQGIKINGAIPPLPHTFSWGWWLIRHRDFSFTFTLLYTTASRNISALITYNKLLWFQTCFLALNFNGSANQMNMVLSGHTTCVQQGSTTVLNLRIN
jgi:hypothetical protein